MPTAKAEDINEAETFPLHQITPSAIPIISYDHKISILVSDSMGGYDSRQ